MRIDIRFLTRPRNGGFTLKYKLPKELEGQPNPKTGKPMGKTLHLGLGTSDLREAAHRRHVIIGQLPEMQEELRRTGRFSTERAVELGKRWQRGGGKSRLIDAPRRVGLRPLGRTPITVLTRKSPGSCHRFPFAGIHLYAHSGEWLLDRNAQWSKSYQNGGEFLIHNR